MEGILQVKGTSALVQALIRDAISLLPKDMRRRMKERSENALPVSPSYVVEKIYGIDQVKEATIPEVIYYEGFEHIYNIERKIEEGKSKLTDSKKLYRDQYNLALNLLVNMWLTDVNNSRHKGHVPKGGIYLRDSTGELYFYEEG